MKRTTLIWTASIALGCLATPRASAETAPCQGNVRDGSGISAAGLVAQAELIVLAQMDSYVEDSARPPFSGYYRFNSMSDLKGAAAPGVQIWGGDPYTEIPQHYIDITETHKSLNAEALYGGVTGLIETNGACVPLPRFKIGWNYLVILGPESTLAFEPINSPQLDAWFQIIQQLAREEDRN